MEEDERNKISELKNLIARAPVIVLLGLPLAPFGLHLFYYCDWGISSWNPNDILQYAATAIPAYGTIALTYYTVLININLQEINEKLVRITEQSALREAKEQMPLVDIVKNGDGKNPKIEMIYDVKYKMYRVKFWVSHEFEYAIKSVHVCNAAFGLADGSFQTNTIEMDEKMQFEYNAQLSYVQPKSLLPKQETVFALYFYEPEGFDDKRASLFCLFVEFENENNSRQRLREELKISFFGKPGLDDEIYKLYSQEIHYDWC